MFAAYACLHIQALCLSTSLSVLSLILNVAGKF
uniref:Uncharacterized protein n=1 Tax=Rhizophora mucronata TaxID=61149 RepID=A0A2P2NCQ0_RHIMU